MELKEFIKDALLQIVSAVDEAQDETLDKHHAINPQTTVGGGQESKYVQNINFDIAVQVTKEGIKGAGAKLTIPFVDIGVGGEVEKKDISSHTSRIQFTVPIGFAYIEKNLKKGYVNLETRELIAKK